MVSLGQFGEMAEHDERQQCAAEQVDARDARPPGSRAPPDATRRCSSPALAWRSKCLTEIAVLKTIRSGDNQSHRQLRHSVDCALHRPIGAVSCRKGGRQSWIDAISSCRARHSRLPARPRHRRGDTARRPAQPARHQGGRHPHAAGAPAASTRCGPRRSATARSRCCCSTAAPPRRTIIWRRSKASCRPPASRCIYYDQLGCGNSDHSRRHRRSGPCPASSASWRKCARASGSTSSCCFGHSWGGILGIEYALNYQQHLRGLVISNMAAGVQAVLKRTQAIKDWLPPAEAQAARRTRSEAGL